MLKETWREFQLCIDTSYWNLETKSYSKQEKSSAVDPYNATYLFLYPLKTLEKPVQSLQ